MTLPITVTTQDNDVSEFKELGVTECNWHLMLEDFNDIHAAINKIKALGLKPVSLHSPFSEDWEPLRIELLPWSQLHQQSIHAAEDICQAFGTKLPIVFHTNVDHVSMRMIEVCAPYVQRLLNECPSVQLLIENAILTPPADCENNKVADDVVNAMRILKKETGKDIGTCFDVCHAEILCNISSLYYSNTLTPHMPVTMDRYMEIFSESCKLVHLAHAIGTGLFPKQHGRGFQGHERLLETYMGMLLRYFPNATYVLEIGENNYESRPNALATCKILQSMKG